MNWFERLTGFEEMDCEATQAKLAVRGDRLHSLVKGKTYGIGTLELAASRTCAHVSMRHRAVRFTPRPRWARTWNQPPKGIIMSTIGNFTASGNGYTGTVRTLAQAPID